MLEENRVVALVLAAGRATRFGGDKRGIELDGGKTLLGATVESVAPFFESVFVVVRPEDDIEALHLGPVEQVRSLNADRGMGFSIADGFTALKNSQAVAAAVLLGDMPCIEPDTYSVLMEHVAADRIVRPEYHGRAGHPVIFGRDFWGELCQLQGEEGARSVIHRHLEACMHIAVDDPGVLMDADRPEDLEALRERYRSLHAGGSGASPRNS